MGKTAGSCRNAFNEQRLPSRKNRCIAASVCMGEDYENLKGFFPFDNINIKNICVQIVFNPLRLCEFFLSF